MIEKDNLKQSLKEVLTDFFTDTHKEVIMGVNADKNNIKKNFIDTLNDIKSTIEANDKKLNNIENISSELQMIINNLDLSNNSLQESIESKPLPGNINDLENFGKSIFEHFKKLIETTLSENEELKKDNEKLQKNYDQCVIDFKELEKVKKEDDLKNKNSNDKLLQELTTQITNYKNKCIELSKSENEKKTMKAKNESDSKEIEELKETINIYQKNYIKHTEYEKLQKENEDLKEERDQLQKDLDSYTKTLTENGNPANSNCNDKQEDQPSDYLQNLEKLEIENNLSTNHDYESLNVSAVEDRKNMDVQVNHSEVKDNQSESILEKKNITHNNEGAKQDPTPVRNVGAIPK